MSPRSRSRLRTLEILRAVPVAGGQQGSRPLSQQNVQRVAAPFGALPPLEHGLTVAVVVVEHSGTQRVRRPDPGSR